jgi:hypothetical protein
MHEADLNDDREILINAQQSHACVPILNGINQGKFHGINLENTVQ